MPKAIFPKRVRELRLTDPYAYANWMYHHRVKVRPGWKEILKQRNAKQKERRLAENAL